MLSPELIKLLAHDLRWSLLKNLTISDYQVHELVELIEQPMNLVSYHLKKLREGEIVFTRRSDADGRDIYYSLDLEMLRQQYLEAGAALHPAFGAVPQQAVTNDLRILVVCTHNSARSQMAEGLLRQHDHIDVHSAGSHPTTLHPDAIRTMDSMGIDIRGQHSKHISEFTSQHFDYVITVCDNAREVCPSFPGGVQLHWGFSDPTMLEDPEARREAFQKTAQRLKSRIEYFLMEQAT